MTPKTRIAHPFAGGVKAAGITKQHRPLIWECMLGTVYAKKPGTDEEKYFDYDYEAARDYAGVDQCSDLRTSRTKKAYQGWPNVGKLALWGVPSSAEKKA